jgi:hypoxanthine phosphoribosyltransferase
LETEDIRLNETNPPAQVAFVHPSEAALARIFDFYQIEWEYEPRTFPLEWDDDGQVIEAFSPDFYLPEQDLYIELTTLRQKLITKKHRKLRRLRELYPDVKIKLLNRADFQRIMHRYGVDNHHELVGQQN